MVAEPTERELRLLAEAANDHVRLAALDEDEADALVRTRLGAATLSDEVADAVKARAHGHPLYSQELAQGLRDAGLIVVQAGVARAAPGVDLASAALPDTIGSVITARIDRLSPAEQQTLKIASVVGRVFELRLLRALHPAADAESLTDVIARLEEQELVTVETAGAEPTYAFRHALIVDAVYGLMLFSQRRALHRAIAEWIEADDAAESARPSGLLAHHWASAGEDMRALAYLEAAGEQALRSGAYVEARSFLERALATWERTASPIPTSADSLRRGRVERQLGEAEYGLGRPVAARAALERALETITGRPAFAGGAPARILAGLARQVAHRVALPGLANAKRKEQALECTRAWGQLGLVYYMAGDATKVFAASLNGLNAAEVAGPSPELAAAYAQLAVLAGFTHANRLVDVYLAHARTTTASVHQSTSASGMVHAWTGIHFANQADWGRAREEYTAAMRIFDALGDRRRWTECACALSTVTHFQGRFEERLPLGAGVSVRGRDTRDVQSQAWGLLDQAESLLPLGRVQEAHDMLQRITTSFRDGLPKIDVLWLHGLYSQAALATGDPERARREAMTAVRLMQDIEGAVFYVMEGYAGATETLLELGERPGASDDAALAEATRIALSRFHVYALMLRLGMPRYALCAGRAAWASGRRGAARRAWAKSLASAERLAMPYEAARARYEIARHLDPDTPARHEELERARAGFARVGAATYERRAREQIALARAPAG